MLKHYECLYLFILSKTKEEICQEIVPKFSNNRNSQPYYNHPRSFKTNVWCPFYTY